MISIQYAPTFIRMYNKLDSNLKEEIKEKITLFQDISNHKSMKVHKLKGFMDDTYSFSVNYKIRIIFEYADKSTVSPLFIGDHDEVYS